MTNQDRVFEVMRTIWEWKPGHKVSKDEIIDLVDMLNEVWESMDSLSTEEHREIQEIVSSEAGSIQEAHYHQLIKKMYELLYQKTNEP